MSDDEAGMQYVMNLAEEAVRRYGWGVMMVGGEGQIPSYGYTYGLRTNYGHADLCVIGLPYEVTGSVLNDLGRRVRDGETLHPGQRLVRCLDPYDGVLVDMSIQAVADNLAFVMAFDSELPPRAFQLVWPDEGGHFPWELGYDAPFTPQPLWGRPPSP